MIVQTSPMQAVFHLPEQPFSSINGLLLNHSEKQLNTIAYKHSWTVAQVADHVTKSTMSIAKAMDMEALPNKREPDEKIVELKKMFLDFTVKYKSPEFILPDKQEYEKETVIRNLKHAFQLLEERANAGDLSGMIKHPLFGDITKLELLYFVLFHSKRHLRQINNIVNALKE